jgi:hypothetical protein
MLVGNLRRSHFLTALSLEGASSGSWRRVYHPEAQSPVSSIMCWYILGIFKKVVPEFVSYSVQCHVSHCKLVQRFTCEFQL